jgi:hypothetical protein
MSGNFSTLKTSELEGKSKTFDGSMSVSELDTAVQGNSNMNTALLAQDRTKKIIQDHLADKNDRIQTIEEDEMNKRRDAQFDVYQAKRYAEHTKIAGSVIISMIVVIGLLVLSNKQYIPQNVSYVGIGAVGIGAGIVIVYQVIDAMSRDSMDYDSYDFQFNPTNNDPTVIEYDKQQIGQIFGTQLSAIGIGGCRNASCCSTGQGFDSKTNKCMDTDEPFTLFSPLGVDLKGGRSVQPSMLSGNTLFGPSQFHSV